MLSAPPCRMLDMHANMCGLRAGHWQREIVCRSPYCGGDRRALLPRGFCTDLAQYGQMYVCSCGGAVSGPTARGWVDEWTASIFDRWQPHLWFSLRTSAPRQLFFPYCLPASGRPTPCQQSAFSRDLSNDHVCVLSCLRRLLPMSPG